MNAHAFRCACACVCVCVCVCVYASVHPIFIFPTSFSACVCMDAILIFPVRLLCTQVSERVCEFTLTVVGFAFRIFSWIKWFNDFQVTKLN